MIETQLHRPHLGDGEEGGFWSVSFRPHQLLYAGVETQDISHLTVHVDDDTGELTLSDGYEHGSQEHRDENALFSEFRDAIVQEMVRDHRFASRTAFLASAAADETARAERLESLKERLVDQEDLGE